ncbi:hypothetical protein [Planktomarina sp.]|uniref:hypothetical protein n=1 Tax=Planktomarina sp. TaxID=2024851 RepID=UPI003261D0F2
MRVKIGNYPNFRFYHAWLYRLFGYSPSQKVSVKIDPWDTYSMDYTLANIVLPMLIQLKTTSHSYPSDLNEKKWDNILDKMIYSFELKLQNDGYDLSEKEEKKMQEGFVLFGKYYQNLWD